MMEIITISTNGDYDLINITEDVEKILHNSKLKEGFVNLFVRHTTAGIIIMEDEQGIKMDFKKAFEKIAPIDAKYNHNKIQDDDNGHSHICGSLLGSTINIPFKDGELLLGTWQQIFLVDFDTHPRDREVVVSIIGK